MADTSKATKYDLVQRKRVLDDIWLCTSRPQEKCYKPCKIHNPAACDGAGLPGVDWDDDDVFEPAEDSDDSPVDTSFSDSEVWDSDTDTIEEVTHEASVVNREMERWMHVADMFYNQQDPQPSHGPGVLPAPPTQPAYLPWNPAYGPFPPMFPMLPGALPFHHPVAFPTSAHHQNFINANNSMNNDPWAMISNRTEPMNQDSTTSHHQSSRAWDDLFDEQERYQDDIAAAIASQTVGAIEECVTSSDNQVPVSFFSASTDFWRRHQQEVNSQS